MIHLALWIASALFLGLVGIIAVRVVAGAVAAFRDEARCRAEVRAWERAHARSRRVEKTPNPKIDTGFGFGLLAIVLIALLAIAGSH